MNRAIALLSITAICATLGGACHQERYQQPNAANPTKDPEPAEAAPRDKFAGPERTPAEERGNLAEGARRSVRSVMFEHGQNMENLLWSALMLRYEKTHKLAQWIADNATEVQPASDVPEEFYVMRTEMREAATRLAAAATKRDDKELAAAYGALSATCVSCHTKYLWSR
jgi:hypothetical protein